MAGGGRIPPREDHLMNSILRTAARWMTAVVVALPLTASAAPIAARAVGPPAFVTPDTARTKAYFIKLADGDGSFDIPTLNGLSGTTTYRNAIVGEKAKIYTAWGTYGSPPPPSNGGTIIAYLVMRFSFQTLAFSATASPSTIAYSKLNPSKAYSIDVWDVTNTPSEYKLWSIGSPSNGTLSFESPLNDFVGQEHYEVVDLELVQNP
jgi:hypothetical protein